MNFDEVCIFFLVYYLREQSMSIQKKLLFLDQNTKAIL